MVPGAPPQRDAHRRPLVVELEDVRRDEEEERRLFYVAVTRAKKKLYLTLARVRKIYGTDFMSEASSFLHDIDSSLVAYAGTEGDGEDIIEM